MCTKEERNHWGLGHPHMDKAKCSWCNLELMPKERAMNEATEVEAVRTLIELYDRYIISGDEIREIISKMDSTPWCFYRP